MSIDDEITATAAVIQAARDGAGEHLQRARDALHLESTALARYKDLLNATILAAESTLAHCRKLASIHAISVNERTTIVQGITDGVRESVRAMYVTMTIIEELAKAPSLRDSQQGAIYHAANSDTLRSCSFCGKTETQTKLAAGPAASICTTCARLVCGVLGIRLSDSPAE